MPERIWAVERAGRRVNLFSRDPADPSQDRLLGSLPEQFRVVFDVAVVLRASGIPPDRWVSAVGTVLGGGGAPAGPAGYGGSCRSCGAEILWSRTQAGKVMPLDAKPEKRVVVDHETARVVDAYLPHWASCPNAEAHRRGKESERS